MEEHIKKITKEIVHLLVIGDYESIVLHSSRKRINAEQIKSTINEYPGTLTPPPESDYENIDIFKINNQSQWMADFFLWVDNEPSDLMIKIAFELQNDILLFTFWDIYVP